MSDLWGIIFICEYHQGGYHLHKNKQEYNRDHNILAPWLCPVYRIIVAFTVTQITVVIQLFFMYCIDSEVNTSEQAGENDTDMPSFHYLFNKDSSSGEFSKDTVVMMDSPKVSVCTLQPYVRTHDLYTL